MPNLGFSGNKSVKKIEVIGANKNMVTKHKNDKAKNSESRDKQADVFLLTFNAIDPQVNELTYSSSDT